MGEVSLVLVPRLSEHTRGNGILREGILKNSKICTQESPFISKIGVRSIAHHPLQRFIDIPASIATLMWVYVCKYRRVWKPE